MSAARLTVAPPAAPSTSVLGSTPVQLGPSGAWQAKPRRWIPEPNDAEAHPNRTLVLCFDGTGDQFDNDNSNIVQFMAMLKKDDSSKQVVYYQAGIGTYVSPYVFGPGAATVYRTLDLMFALNLGEHVRAGYEFLMQNYCVGDKICIFGFSRGAYTARALAGMLQKVGLLPAWNQTQLPFAWTFFARQDNDALALTEEFKRTFSIDVKIEFVGVWDTVASVGMIPRYLPFVATNNAIRYFRHALALDEHRIKFVPSYYKQAQDEAELMHHSLDHDHSKEATGQTLVGTPGTSEGKKGARPGHAAGPSQDFLYQYKVNAETGQKTDALEVWFSGAHCDIGGGSVANHTRHALARIPLRWMIRECFRAKTGIIFDMDMLRDEVGLGINTDLRRVLEPPPRLSPRDFQGPDMRLVPGPVPAPVAWSGIKKTALLVVTPLLWITRFALFCMHRAFPRTRPVIVLPPKPAAVFKERPYEGEAMEELKDSLQPSYDQLALARGWWFLEWLPMTVKKEKAIYDLTDRYMDYAYIINRGKGRKVFKHVCQRGIRVHRSVLTRLEALDAEGREGGYVPLVRPNIVVENDGFKSFAHFKQMTRDQWLAKAVEGYGNSWFEWAGGDEDLKQE